VFRFISHGPTFDVARLDLTTFMWAISRFLIDLKSELQGTASFYGQVEQLDLT
jgi:hypothetical protein